MIYISDFLCNLENRSWIWFKNDHNVKGQFEISVVIECRVNDWNKWNVNDMYTWENTLFELMQQKRMIIHIFDGAYIMQVCQTNWFQTKITRINILINGEKLPLFYFTIKNNNNQSNTFGGLSFNKQWNSLFWSNRKQTNQPN